MACRAKLSDVPKVSKAIPGKKTGVIKSPPQQGESCDLIRQPLCSREKDAKKGEVAVEGLRFWGYHLLCLKLLYKMVRPILSFIYLYICIRLYTLLLYVCMYIYIHIYL